MWEKERREWKIRLSQIISVIFHVSEFRSLRSAQSHSISISGYSKLMSLSLPMMRWAMKKMQHNGSKQCNKLELEIPQHSLNSLVAAARVNRTIRKFNDIIMINYFSIESQLMIRLSLIDVELLLRCLIGLIQYTKNRWMDSIALCECFVLQHLILWNLKAIKVNQYMSIISCYWKIESVHESSTAIIQWKSKSPSSSKTDNI